MNGISLFFLEYFIEDQIVFLDERLWTSVTVEKTLLQIVVCGFAWVGCL